MLVLYYFQGENGESLDRPNAFNIEKAGAVTFGDFLAGFPLKSFINSSKFRFRAEDETFGYVWLDIFNKSETLPIYSGVITAKILKLDTASVKTRKIILRKKKTLHDDTPIPLEKPVAAARPPPYSSTPSNPAATVRRPAEETNAPSIPPPKPQQSKPAANQGNTTPKSPQKPASTSAKVEKAEDLFAKSNSVDVFGDDEFASPFHASTTNSTSNSAPTSANLVNDPDLINPIQSAGNSSGAFDLDDFLSGGGGSSSPAPKSSGGSSRAAQAKSTSSGIDIDIDIDDNGGSGKGGLSRAELVSRKEEHISEKVKGALEFKKDLDNKAEKEAADFDAAREKHEKALLAWATNNKEKRNVRTLLSTMHTVLPPGNKWKAIGLGDVLEPGQVKKQYRKAMLVVHPDHCLNADAETKFICKRVFEAINEAYDEFTKKEGV